MKAGYACTLATLLALQVTAAAAERASRPRSQDDSAGAHLYDKLCAACHGLDVSPTYPGTFALAKTHGKEFAVLTQRRDLDPEMIRRVVRDGLGFMPGFRVAELSDTELAQLTRYLAKQAP